MLPGRNAYKSCRREVATRDGTLVAPLPCAPPAVGRHATCDSGPNGLRTDKPRCSVLVSSSVQLLGSPSAAAASSSSSSSSVPAEVLRPRRYSAPVIARLIRSTTTLQELTNVVQQQLPYFDPGHVGIALLHVALLAGQLQKSAQLGGEPTAPAASHASNATATAAPGLGAALTGPMAGPYNVSDSSYEDATTSGVGLGGAGATTGGSKALNFAIAAGSNDDELQPLVMPSILDEDGSDGYEGHSGAGSGAAGEAAGDLLMLSDIGDEGESLQPVDTGEATGSANGITENGRGSNAASSSTNGNGAGTIASSSGGRGAVHLSSGARFQVEGCGMDGQPAEPDALIDAAAAAAALPTAAEDCDPDRSPSRVLPATSTSAGAANRADRGEATNNRNGNGAVSTSPALGAGLGPGQAHAGGGRVPDATAAAGPSSPITPSQSPLVAGLLRTLLPQVFSSLDSLRGSDLAAVLSSLAALRYGDRLVVGQLMQVMAGKLSACRPQDLSNIWCSAALLGVPPDPDVRSSFYSVVRRRARRFAPRDLAMTVWSYGAVGCDVPEETLLALLDASRTKMTGFAPLYLAKMAQGLAALRYRPSPEWVDAYCQALRPALRRMSSRELCALLLALASLQIALDDTTRATLLVHTLTSLPSLAPSELAQCIWALGRLTAAGQPALIDLDTSGRVLDVTGATLGSFSAGELQQLLEGLTRLALQPPLDWMQAYVAVLQPRLAEMDARQLAGVLGSLAAQQYRPMPEMQEVVLAATQANMQQLLADTTCTASLVTALRRLNIEPPPSWVEALLEASRSALKNRCSDLHLANLAGSLAAWGVRPDGRWAARLMWRSLALMAENRMSPRALAALLQAMIALGIRPNAVWSALCLRAAAARASQPSFEPQHYSTVMAALHALGVQPPQWWLSRMLLSTYRCWDGFNMSHWSSLLPALALLKARPPREWLSRLEATTAPRLANCSALQLLTLLVSIHQLHQLQAAGAAEPLQLRGPGRGVDGRARGEARPGARKQRSKRTAEPAAAAAALAAPSEALAGATGARLHRRSVQVPARAAAEVPAPEAATAAAANPALSDTDAAASALLASRPSSSTEPAAAGAPSSSSSGSSPAASATPPASAPAAAVADPFPLPAGAAAATAALVRPDGAWLAAWWASSTRLLATVRYAPSELALTAGWLATLELVPPPEWLQACVDAAERYGKVMGPEERQQLAAAVLPLVRGLAAEPVPQQVQVQEAAGEGAPAPAPASAGDAVL